MSDHRPTRIATVQSALASRDIDALLVTHLPNIRWLTGFSGSAAILVLTRDHLTLLTDFRYAVQGPKEAGDVAQVLIDRANIWERLKRLLSLHPEQRVGVEAHVLPARDVERVNAMVPHRVVQLDEFVEAFRQIKDESEIAAIRAAAAVAQDALAEVLPTITAGEREIDVAARLESALRRRGSEWHPFQTIIASGPRAAIPHARSSTRELGRGEFLLIDFGAIVDGYASDITRTVVIGAADDRQRSVYQLVYEAQRRAREEIRAGMTGIEADALARDLIAARGYGDAFGHSLGHGLGLEVHEAPRVAATAEAVLPVGAVVTIEPGIYLPGWGGVRLEDDVWLEEDRPTLLSDGRTDLIILD